MITMLPEVQQDGTCRIYARSGEQVLGQAQYRTEGETIYLLQVQASLPALCDGLLRAALNAAMRDGCLRAVCTQQALFALLQQEGFSVQNGQAHVMLETFFARGCRH